MQLPQDLIEMAQIGVSEQIRADFTAAELLAWIERNADQLHPLSRMVLEELIAEQTQQTIH